MGCDIHWFVENKIDGVWKFDPEAPEFEGRDYTLFAILAGVRDRYNTTPIAAPRGLPADASKAVMDESEHWGNDAHSRTWLSLEELMSYDWDAPVTQTGMIGLKDYIQFKKDGYPSSWARAIWGPEEVSNEKMDAIIEAKKEGDYCTSIEWTVPGKHKYGYFCEYLKELSEYVKEAETRIVFWFDN